MSTVSASEFTRGASALADIDLDAHFPRYTRYDPQVPVWCVTPGQGRAIHRFFDTSPISPSGRYLAVTRLGNETELPKPGDTADICLIDLATGQDRVVATTAGWEPQMGANVNWGGDDHRLVFQDLDPATWLPKVVVLDPLTGDRREIAQAGVYHVSPDGRYACATHPAAMRRTQHGYGVVVPDEHVPRHVGPVDDDGLWITDLDTGERRLVVSLRDAIESSTPAFEIDDPSAYEIYGFHSKFNPQGDRLIFTIRFFKSTGSPVWNAMATGDLRFTVLTCRPDGSDLRNAVPASRWLWGGHHIHWYPDGRTLSMNLRLGEGEPLQFVRCGYDGGDLRAVREDLVGSGHPTVHPDGRHWLTDTYTREPTAFGDGTVPLRWMDMRSGTERRVVRFNTQQPVSGSALRVDPHPAWDRTWRWVTFNGYLDGSRRVLIADFHRLIG